jgi:protein-S-isoprenylcysteine O-methyltransferase Ste14
MALQEDFEKQGMWLFKNRGKIPFIILFFGVLVFLWTEIHPEHYFVKNEAIRDYYIYFCLLISLLGLGIRVFTVGYTPANTSGRNTKTQLADELNTTGIYSVVRHPLYLGNFFMWLGPVLLTGHFWFVLVVYLFYWIYYERIMFSEEQFLRRKFGSVYTSWAENVPAFIPRFKDYVKPGLPFSWKKVLKKEKNGLAVVFFIFCAMDITGKLIRKSTDFNWFLIAFCILTLILYAVLKYLKYKTNVLNEEGR